MLDALIAAFVDRATEREFDAPLLAILRKRGFTHVAFIHGAFEFGQDISARLPEGDTTWQYALQSKAGDVGASEWRNDLKPQLQQLVEKETLHGPAFDPALPRRVVGVLTGRFKGSATVESQEYRVHVAKHYGIVVDYWDRERLIEFLVGTPDALLGELEPALVFLIGSLMTGEATTLDIEGRSRTWIGDNTALLRGATEAAVLAHFASATGRPDLACHVACCLVRAALWAESQGAEDAMDVRAAAIRLLVGTGTDMLELPRDDAFFVPASDGPATFITYPARVLRLVEYLALVALVADEPTAGLAREVVAELVDTQPGAAHPLSDRWGPSVANAAVALGRGSPELVSHYLRRVAKWVADRRESGLGLAPYNARPREEVDQLLGAALEHVDVPKRRDSDLAALLLDLAVALDDGGLVDDLLNEWQAVALSAPALVFDDSANALVLTGQGALHPDVVRSGFGADGSWSPPHHGPTPQLVREGRAADLMVVATVTRDRHFPAAMKALIQTEN